MDGKNFALGVLTLTAVVLFSTLVIVGNQPAHARGVLDKGGDYTMVTGQGEGSTEMLYVIDAAQGKLIAYNYDQTRKTFTFTQPLDLNRGFSR